VGKPSVVSFRTRALVVALVLVLTGDVGGGRVGGTGGADPAAMTVVFDAGQNSTANFEHLRASGLRSVGSVPPSDCPDLLARPAADRSTGPGSPA
jgi:hypothetical protein